jgi:hypothetical protein
MLSVSIEQDMQSPTGYSLRMDGYIEHFGTGESIERFHDVVAFRFVCLGGSFLAREEIRCNREYWYMFKRVGRRVYKTYIGRRHRLTLHSLEVAANRLHDLIQCGALVS